MRTPILFSLFCLVPAAAFASEAAEAVPMAIAQQPAPVLAVLPPVTAAQLLPTDAVSTRLEIDRMNQAIATMAFAPRVDAVSLAASAQAARWETAISGLADLWAEQTRIAVIALSDAVDGAIHTFPETGLDLGEDSLFPAPIFIDGVTAPVTGFFGP